MAEAMGLRYQELVDKIKDSCDQEWTGVAKENDFDTPAKRNLSALAVASEHIAYETVGQNFDDCDTGTELDDSENEPILELVEYKP